MRLTLVVLFAASACTTAPGPIVADAAPSAAPSSRPPRFVDGGPLPDARVICGDATCGVPGGGRLLGELACCQPSGECGLSAPLIGGGCFAPHQPGSADPSCPSFASPHGALAQGCCAPSGRCGYYDRFGDLGCIAADTSDAAARCTYDPSATCRSVVAVSCDGPEDCAPARVCCARSDFGLYDAFGCFSSCAAAESAAHGVWFETCHSRQDCTQPSDRCEGAPGLVASAGRCVPARVVVVSDAGAASDARAADGGNLDASLRRAKADAASDAAANPEEGVACGASRCRRGQTCCVRDPGEPYCAPLDEGCSCSGPQRHDD